MNRYWQPACPVPVFLLAIAVTGCQETQPEARVTQPETAHREALKLVWADEFEGEALDREKWRAETGATGWGNSELQEYTESENIVVEDGILKITVRHLGRDFERGSFTSARLNSQRAFQYGRMEVRARVPKWEGNGLWPAIWMLPDSLQKLGWPLCGEIDLMEYVSCAPDEVHFTVHSQAHNHGNGTQLGSGPIEHPTIDEEFHVYGCTWTPERIEFFIDDPAEVRFTVYRPEQPTQENWPFDQPFYFLLNVAVGGSWGGMKGIDAAAFPATFEIDYVRVYQE